MIGDNIRSLRNSRNLTMQELSDRLNKQYPDTLNFNKGKLSKWENNHEEPKLSSVRIIADYFNVTVDDLVRGNYESSISVIYEKLDKPRQRKVYNYAENQLQEQNKILTFQKEKDKPLVSGRQSAAGSALYVDDGDARLDVVSSTAVPEDADELVGISGHSMEPLIMDNEKVYMRYQPQVENGEIAIVRIENEGVTCKRVYVDGENVTLKSENIDYKDMLFDSSQVTVLGKVLLK